MPRNKYRAVKKNYPGYTVERLLDEAAQVNDALNVVKASHVRRKYYQELRQIVSELCKRQDQRTSILYRKRAG